MQNKRIRNLAFPSGVINLYARVSDSYGAVSPVYTATIEAIDTERRRAFSQEDWNAAFVELNEAVMLGNNQDVNKLSSALSLEALKQLRESKLSLPRLTDILTKVVAAVDKSVSGSVVTSSYACEVASVLSFVTTPGPPGIGLSTPMNVTGDSTIGNSTVLLISTMVRGMLSSKGVTSITRDCASRMFAVLTNVVTVQALLSAADAISTQISQAVISDVEACAFQVSSLLARLMIASESQEVASSTSQSRISRQLASSAFSQSVTLSNNTLSVTIPSLAGKQFGSEQVAASDLVTSVISLSQKLPILQGVKPLSPGITISVSRGTSKTSLNVQGLPAASPVRFTIPLGKSAPPPPPPPGKLFRCKCCVGLRKLMMTCT